VRTGSGVRTCTNILPTEHALDLLQRTLVPWAIEELRTENITFEHLHAGSDEPMCADQTSIAAKLQSMQLQQLQQAIELTAEHALADAQLASYNDAIRDGFVRQFLTALDSMQYTADADALAKAAGL
jgi:hypothetical protein